MCPYLYTGMHECASDCQGRAITWRDAVNALVDILDCTRYSAENIIKASLLEGYTYA